MDKFFEALLKLLPLAENFQKWFEISKELSVVLASVIIAFLVWVVGWGFKKLTTHYKNSKAVKDLNPYFTYLNVQEARQYFIQTKFQNEPPTKEDEPGFSNPFVSKSYLIPHFLKTAFNEKKETDKFFLILADSGMGKTTFMINLFIKYTSFFNFKQKNKIKLLPFGDSRIIKHLEEIKQEEAKNTILLLDAFDEFKGLQPPAEPDGLSDDDRFRKRLDEIFELVRDFREVVITSRTQYFPGQEKEPYELRIRRFDEKGFHTLAKLYLSPFDDREIKRYLNKKYGRFKFWNLKRKHIAAAIVKNSPKLMVRPMLLSYIDLLVDGKHTFNTSYQIYETLVEKWIDREAKKEKYATEDREKFKKDLHDFSRMAALEIYNQRKESETLSLVKEIAEGLCKTNNINLQGYQITGKSLLTRNASHNWKFAHKSILEFLLAKEMVKNRQFYNQFDFQGWDMTKQFYHEIVPENFVFVEGGTFLLDNYKVSLSDFYMCKYQVTQAEYEKLAHKNPSHFKGEPNLPVEKVSWTNAKEFCNLVNKAKGFKPVYDEKGNLLDENGKVTSDITKVVGFRLPTEAEWEFAARGGKQTRGFKYSGSNNLDEVGWYSENSGKKTHPVGQKHSNELGLYDMSGNVWEWCFDWYGNYPDKEVLNPIGPEMGSLRVFRGGGWIGFAVDCRSEYRIRTLADDRNFNLGFRLVFVP